MDQDKDQSASCNYIKRDIDAGGRCGCRAQGMSRDMADMLIEDINDSVIELEKLQYPTPSRLEAQKQGKVYTH